MPEDITEREYWKDGNIVGILKAAKGPEVKPVCHQARREDCRGTCEGRQEAGRWSNTRPLWYGPWGDTRTMERAEIDGEGRRRIDASFSPNLKGDYGGGSVF